MFFSTRSILNASIGLAAFAIPVGAQAQAASPDSSQSESDNSQTAVDTAGADQVAPDIVVTAQKRSERLQDVPIAVTALSGDALASKGITSVLDLQNATPGLTFTTSVGTASPRIRGIGAGSAYGGNENSVATYVDGVYYASSAGTVMQLSNIAQVAVLKGPQGTLFGRNATGGLIQITTVDPESQLGGKISLTYGNLQTTGASVYLTGGIAPGLAADVTVYYNRQNEGFGINRFSGRDVSASEDFALRSKIRWDFGPNDMLKLAGDYSTSDASVPARRLSSGSLPSAAYAALGVKPFTGNPFDVETNVDPIYSSRRGGGSLEYVHNFPSFDFSSLSAFRRTETRILLDSDGTIVDGGYGDNHLRDKQLTQEFQMVSTGTGPFKWTLGAFYFKGAGGFLPSIVGRPPNVTTIYYSDQRISSPAVYGQASYAFGGGTTLTLGGRYSWESRSFAANGANKTGSGPFVVTAPISGKIVNSEPTWRIALDHRFSPGLLVYASYNRGFKSGGFVGTNFSGSVQTYNPEILDAYEMGFKSDLFDRRVRLNASAYYYNYRNIQIAAYSSGPLPTIINASSAKIYGADIDLLINLLEGLTLTGGFSYNHSRFGTFTNAQIATPIASGGNTVARGDATGNKLPNSPDWTLDLGADYNVPVAAGSVTLSGHFFHSDGWFAEPDNYVRQVPYNLLNGSITWYNNSAKTLGISLFGRNLTNAAYATQTQARATGNVVSIAPGRTYGLTVSYNF